MTQDEALGLFLSATYIGPDDTAGLVAFLQLPPDAQNAAFLSFVQQRLGLLQAQLAVLPQQTANTQARLTDEIATLTVIKPPFITKAGTSGPTNPPPGP